MNVSNCSIVLPSKESIKDFNEKIVLMEEELKFKNSNINSAQSKLTKAEAEYKQNLMQLTYDLDHFKNMYEEAKKASSSQV